VIGLDTNVLVRILVDDDPAQCEEARAMASDVADAGVPLFVADVVVCELVWVLQSAYKVPREDVARLLRKLFSTRQILFESGESLRRTLARFESGRGDFADYLIADRSTLAGCEMIATFDAALLKEPDFALPSDATEGISG